MLLHIRSVRSEAQPDGRALFSHRTNGDITQVSTGSRRFLRNPSCTYALASDPGRADVASPYRQTSADPISQRMKPTDNASISRLNPTASVPAVYASQPVLPLTMQYSLPADG